MQKRMLCLALSTVFSVGAALAAPQDQAPPPQQDQGAPPPPPPDGMRGDRQGPQNPERMFQQISKQLNLSPDQQTQIKPIMADEMSQIMGLRNDSSIPPRDRMQKMKAIRDDSNAKIKAILNPDQRVQFDAMQQQRRDRMMNQRRQGQQDPNGPPPSDNSNQ